MSFNHPIVEYINYKWRKGHSPLVTICGETNTGKTWTALSLAELLTKGRFEPLEYMFVDVKDFLLKFYVSKHKVFIIDEAKVHLDSSRWYSNLNQALGDVIATQRHRNNLYILILPVLKKLARQHRDMIDVIIEMKAQGFALTYKVNRRWSELKEFELWASSTGGMRVPAPSKDIIDKYKKVEKISKDKIMKDIITNLIKIKRCDCGKRKPDLECCEWCGERVGL